MVNRDLLKEAIADAKAVKETAIVNAKAALEEAFTPYLKEKLAAKLAEMDEMDEAKEEMTEMKEKDMKETYDMEEADDKEGYEGQMGMKKLGTKQMEEADEIEEMDLDALLKELGAMEEDEIMEDETMEEDSTMEEGKAAYEYEKGKKAGEKKAMNEEEEDLINNPGGAGNLPKYQDMVEEEDYTDEDADGVEDPEDEEIDIENMDESDLKSFIEGVIADMVAAGELEGGSEGMEGEEEESEEEVEINERKKYGGNKGDVPASKRGDKKDTAEEEGVEDYKKKKLKEGDGVEEGLFDFLKKKKAEAPTKPSGPKLLGVDFDGNYIYDDDVNEMKKELEEAYNALSTIKSELQEVNLFNAKLLYTNKIFKTKTLTESQKVKVLAAFDKAASVKEAKLVFETLSEGMKETKKTVNESMLRGSASRAAGVADKKPILEVNDQFARWQTLAGIKK